MDYMSESEDADVSAKQCKIETEDQLSKDDIAATLHCVNVCYQQPQQNPVDDDTELAL